MQNWSYFSYFWVKHNCKRDAHLDMVYRRTDITELLGHFFANKWITRWAVTFNDIVQFIVKVFINLHTVHAVQTQISNWNSRSFKQAFAHSNLPKFASLANGCILLQAETNSGWQMVTVLQQQQGLTQQLQEDQLELMLYCPQTEEVSLVKWKDTVENP